MNGLSMLENLVNLKNLLYRANACKTLSDKIIESVKF